MRLNVACVIKICMFSHDYDVPQAVSFICVSCQCVCCLSLALIPITCSAQRSFSLSVCTFLPLLFFHFFFLPSRFHFPYLTTLQPGAEIVSRDKGLPGEAHRDERLSQSADRGPLRYHERHPAEGAGIPGALMAATEKDYTEAETQTPTLPHREKPHTSYPHTRVFSRLFTLLV